MPPKKHCYLSYPPLTLWPYYVQCTYSCSKRIFSSKSTRLISPVCKHKHIYMRYYIITHRHSYWRSFFYKPFFNSLFHQVRELCNHSKFSISRFHRICYQKPVLKKPRNNFVFRSGADWIIIDLSEIIV